MHAPGQMKGRTEQAPSMKVGEKNKEEVAMRINKVLKVLGETYGNLPCWITWNLGTKIISESLHIKGVARKK